MELLQKIGSVLAVVYSILIAYRIVFYITGFFTKAKIYPAARKNHTYGVVIAARNEERVIGHLLDSIALQDYDHSLLRVFVVADNCTDGTARLCREKGAVVYERHEPDKARKGWALEWLFRQIDRDYGIDSVDAYLFFDADNLLARDFITQINRAFDAGGDIVVGYRNTKNFDTNFISAAYGIHFYDATVFMHRPRAFFRQSTHIAGTGYAMSSRLLRDSWRWTCLTEDTQLCLSSVAEGVKIDFCEAAEFFDEQPYSVDVMLRQRLRWAKGRLACFFLLFPRLLRGIFTCRERRFSCYDMLFYILPYSLISALASLLYAAVMFVSRLLTAEAPLAALSAPFAAVPGLLSALAVSWLGFVAEGAVVVLRERRHIRCSTGRLLLYVLLWPVFSLTGVPVSIVSLFMRVRWKPIRHDRAIALAELETAGRGTGNREKIGNL